MIRRLLLAGLSLTVFLGFGSAPAHAGPVLNIDLHHHESNFAPGGTGEYWVELHNIGDAPTTGPISVTINLPSGLNRNSIRQTDNFGGGDPDEGPDPNTPDAFVWNCPGSAGQVVITCTTPGPISRKSMNRSLVLAVNVALPTDFVGERFASARVSGGGAALAPPAAGCPAGVAACTSELTQINGTPADFGPVPGSWRGDFYDEDGVTPVRDAGAHPDLATFSFDLNSKTPVPGDIRFNLPVDSLRDLKVDLPEGFLGDATAIGECRGSELIAFRCPPESQVGRFDTLVPSPTTAGSDPWRLSTGVYNMVAPKGSVTDLAFMPLGVPVHVKASLDPERNYSIRTTVSNINETLPVYNQKLTIWGYPADPSHDWERCLGSSGDGHGLDTTSACPSTGPDKPFLTVPFECGVDQQITLSGVDSWQNTGVFEPAMAYSLPGQFTNCAAAQAEFDPEVSITPTSPKADSPTGLEVEASVPFNDDPDEVATPPVKSLEVELPEGMAVNPAFADGLRGCTEAEIGISHAGIPNMDPVTCPDQSRIGSVELSTPLLPTPAPGDMPADCPGTKPLQGSIYLAKQTDNPLNELFAIYTILHDCDDRGVLLKLPGALNLDPDTGQITTVFEDLPQFPFDSLSVKFRGGDRAPLVNPPTCGTHEIDGDLNTYAAPGTDVAVDDSFEVTQDPDGSACSTPTLESRPFAPDFTAGTTSPAAGKHSPFVLKLTRQDGEQEITKLAVDLPPGLVGKLAGISQCSDATLAAIPEDPGTGQAEIDNPSCPANSLVGHTNAGSGAGGQPFYIHGKVYLAGPFDPDGSGPLGTAPLSIAAVTPAVTGGLDLGNVLIRTALYVDQDDAQLHAVSEQIPTIVHGVPIHLRDLRVVMDRPGFTLNPTNCSAMQVTGSISGAGASLVGAGDDTSVSVADPTKADGCGSLGFGPSMAARVINGRAGTGRSAHPNLQFNLTGRPGDANLSRVEVTLPQAFQIDQANLGNICSETQLATQDCAGRQRIGTAQATTPLLDAPLSGPVYAVSGSGGLPKLAVILYGPPSMPIKLVVRGITETVGARIKNTFATVPDAPVSSFELTLDGGPQGYLVNNRNLCTKVKGKGKKKKIVKAGTQYSDIAFFGQNRDTLRQRSPVGVSCKKLKGGKSKKRR